MRQRYRRGDQAFLREINLSTVLRRLHEGAPLSRARLADMTGLNKTTVSSLVEALFARGLVRRVGLDTSGGGRPATLLDLDPDAGCIVGLALGVDFVSAVLTDFDGQVRWQQRLEADPAEGQETIIARTLRLLDQAREANQEQCARRLLGLGLAVPGMVNVQDGVMIFSPNLQWRNVPLRQILHEHTGLPVFVDNDANAAAVGEHLFGVARQTQNFIFIFAGVGVGGGLFLKGEIYRGATGFAGEIGHTNYLSESYRTPCRCGNRGCWETFANQYSIVQRVRSRLVVGRDSLIPGLMEAQNSPLTLPVILQAADAGDVQALEALDETGSALGLGLANLVNIFNPEMVVVGGLLGAAGRHLLPAIEQAVAKTALPEFQRQVQVLLSAFGPDASVMGAVALVIEAVLSDPGSIEPIKE
jgi:glucokinase-like ROK family protein